MKRIFCILAVCVIVVLAAGVIYGQEYYVVGTATTTGALNYVGPYTAAGTAVHHTFKGTTTTDPVGYRIVCPTLETANASDEQYIDVFAEITSAL